MENEELKNKEESRQSKKGVALTVGLCFLMIMFGLGMWASKSLFVVPISNALNISRSVYSISDTMRYVSTAIVNLFFGTLVAKFGAKKLICAGFICLIASALLYAFAGHFIVLYLGGFLLGIGLSWTGTTVIGYVINKTVKNNRGTVMGFILAANGVGGAIAAQAINAFLKDTADVFAYRKAFYMMAIVFAVVMVILLVFLKEPKSDGVSSSSANKKSKGSGWIGIEYKAAVKKPYFIGAAICIFLTGLVLQGVTGVYAAHMKDVGLSQDFIGLISSISLVALAAFKFVNGVMYDKLGLRATITVDCVAAIGVMASLYFMTNSTFGMVLGVSYAILAAIALPLETVMLPIYANDLFGDKSFNKVLGIFVSFNQIGYALGGPIINLCSDLTGSYNLAFIICAILMLAVIITLQFVISSAHKTRVAIESSLSDNSNL